MIEQQLERIAVALERIANASGNVGNLNNGLSSSSQNGVGTVSGTIAPQNATGMDGASAVSGTGQGGVTHEMLMNLVQPLVQDEGTKAQVKSVLNAHGLNRLGEAQEAQYASLYAAFQQIGGGAPASQSNDLI